MKRIALAPRSLVSRALPERENNDSPCGDSPWNVILENGVPSPPFESKKAAMRFVMYLQIYETGPLLVMIDERRNVINLKGKRK